MRKRDLSDVTVEDRAHEAFHYTYYESVGNLNRKDRRTAKGRQVVAEAKLKASLAKISVLEEELRKQKGGAA